MDELMARVGFVLLHWGWLENDVRSVGQHLPRQTDDPEFEFARRVRNMLAHGMYEASADPNRSEDAYVMCRSDDRERVRVTYADLKRAIAALQTRRFS